LPSGFKARYPPAYNEAAMMPIVFWASLAPWPKETAAADTSCSPLNALASECTPHRRWMRAITAIATNATVKARAGDATMAITAVRTTPQLIAASPPAARPAPTSPPMIA